MITIKVTKSDRTKWLDNVFDSIHSTPKLKLGEVFEIAGNNKYTGLYTSIAISDYNNDGLKSCVDCPFSVMNPMGFPTCHMYRQTKSNKYHPICVTDRTYRHRLKIRKLDNAMEAL